METEWEKMLPTKDLERAAFKWVSHTYFRKKNLCDELVKPSADFSPPFTRSSAQERSAPSLWCWSLTVPPCCPAHISYSLSLKHGHQVDFINFVSGSPILSGNTDVLPDLQQVRGGYPPQGPHLGQPKLKLHRQETKPWLHMAQTEQEGAHKTDWERGTDVFSDFERDQWNHLRGTFLLACCSTQKGSPALGQLTAIRPTLWHFHNRAMFLFSAWTSISARWLSVVLQTHSWGKCLWRWCFSF